MIVIENMGALLAIPLISGLIFTLAGIVLRLFPPKNINQLYGYRTTRSMQNQKTWDFAQRYSAIELMKLGTLLMLSSCIGLINAVNEIFAISVGLGLLILTAIWLFVRVERTLRKKFSK